MKAHGSWRLSYPGVACLFRLRVVVERLTTLIHCRRVLLRPQDAARCDYEVGDAYCVLP